MSLQVIILLITYMRKFLAWCGYGVVDGQIAPFLACGSTCGHRAPACDRHSAPQHKVARQN